jgi:hypothetical protein
MSPEDSYSVQHTLRNSMRIETLGSPATSADIAMVEARLGVAFPSWLRTLYLTCDGFTGPTDWQYLFPLAGHLGVIGYTEWLRREEWGPAWLSRAFVFGQTCSGGTGSTFFAVLDGLMIEWCLGDGAEFTQFSGSFFDLLRREQATWDEVAAVRRAT